MVKKTKMDKQAEKAEKQRVEAEKKRLKKEANQKASKPKKKTKKEDKSTSGREDIKTVIGISLNKVDTEKILTLVAKKISNADLEHEEEKTEPTLTKAIKDEIILLKGKGEDLIAILEPEEQQDAQGSVKGQRHGLLFRNLMMKSLQDKANTMLANPDVEKSASDTIDEGSSEPEDDLKAGLNVVASPHRLSGWIQKKHNFKKKLSVWTKAIGISHWLSFQATKQKQSTRKSKGTVHQYRMAMRVASKTRLVSRKSKSSLEDKMVEKTGLQRTEVEGCEEVFPAEVEAKYAVVLPRMNIVGRKKTPIAPLQTPGPPTSSCTPESPGEPTTLELKAKKMGARLVLPVKPDPTLLRSTKKTFPALTLDGNVAGKVPRSSGSMKRTSNTEHTGRRAALDSEDGGTVHPAARGRLDHFQINLNKMSLSGGKIGDGLTWAKGPEPEGEDAAAIPSSTTQPLSSGEANAEMSDGCSLYEEETNREVAQLMDVGGIHTITQPEVHWPGNLQMNGDPQVCIICLVL